MKKWISGLFVVAILLGGCAPKFDKQNQVVQQKDNKAEKAIIPNYQISDDYYRTVLPFKPSKARGMVVENLNSRYDINEFEKGLTRIAHDPFAPDKFLFQEGQFLDRETVSLWLNRQYTEAQLKENGLKKNENIGLNPLDDGKGSIEDRNEKNPIYLAHILEHDYLVKTNDEKIKLGGIVIGLALNSVSYYEKEKYGPTYEVKLNQADIKANGEKMAAQVLTRLRKDKDLKDVPITIALFKQAEKNSVTPGNFFEYTNVGKADSTIGGWDKVNEKYYLFPSTEAENDHRDDQTFFLNFKQDIEKYFPNFTAIVGRALYRNDQLANLNIEIPIQFNSNSEVIGFTQYVTGLILDHFPDYVSVQIEISSVDGPEALITKEPKQKEPTVHIYD